MSHEALTEWLAQAEEELETNQKWMSEFKEKIDKYVLKYIQNIPKDQ